MKISNNESNEVTNFIDLPNTQYSSLTIQNSKVHDYLGMHLDYSTPQVLTVLMVDYIKKLIFDFPELTQFTFRHHDEAKPQLEDQAIAFSSHCSATPIHLDQSQKWHPNTGGFPHDKSERTCQRHWEKREHVLKYLHVTLDLRLWLEVDTMPVVKCWIWITPRSWWLQKHTGASMSLRKGKTIMLSQNQKKWHKLYWKWNDWCQWCIATHIVD